MKTKKITKNVTNYQQIVDIVARQEKQQLIFQSLLRVLQLLYGETTVWHDIPKGTNNLYWHCCVPNK